MTKNPFPDWFEEVANDPITVNPDDIIAECNPNTWRFSLSLDVARTITSADVKNFVQAIVDARSTQLRALGIPTGSTVFYCWHDEMVGQLRFSLVSASHGSLPFGVSLEMVELDSIIESWLHSSCFDLIPWSELSEVHPEKLNELEKQHSVEIVQQVWSTLI